MTLNEYNFSVYSKPDCPNCDKAVWLLEQAGYSYEKLILGVDYNVLGLQHLCSEFGASVPRSVPQIFVESFGQDEYVGGLKELETFLRNH